MGGGPATTRAAFFHCGPRHHSLAIVQVAAPKRLQHFMLQVCQLRDVGTTFDRCRDAAIPVTMDLGCHTNDQMVSVYARTPTGFHFEYGHGGLEIDDDVWKVQTYQAASTWGIAHRPRRWRKRLPSPESLRSAPASDRSRSPKHADAAFVPRGRSAARLENLLDGKCRRTGRRRRMAPRRASTGAPSDPSAEEP